MNIQAYACIPYTSHIIYFDSKISIYYKKRAVYIYIIPLN